jgi:hypothetical protein
MIAIGILKTQQDVDFMTMMTLLLKRHAVLVKMLPLNALMTTLPLTLMEMIAHGMRPIQKDAPFMMIMILLLLSNAVLAEVTSMVASVIMANVLMTTLLQIFILELALLGTTGIQKHVDGTTMKTLTHVLNAVLAESLQIVTDILGMSTQLKMPGTLDY